MLEDAPGPAGAPGPAAARRRGLLAGLLLAGTWIWLAQHHLDQVDRPWMAQKTGLHEAVLGNRAPDPYQYKFWLPDHAFEAVRRATGAPLERVLYANTLLSLGVLVLCHHLWLRSLVGPPAALAGSLLLAALAHVLFLTYAHQPQDFWGAALTCLLLRDAGLRRDWRRLVLLALAAGLVWEKHALLAIPWALWRRSEGDPVARTVAKALALFAASLVGFVGTRWLLGTDRPAVDGDTPLAAQAWAKVLWYQVPWLAPFLAILLLDRASVPPWVRWLWVQVPLWLAAYAASAFVLHEVRSFWVFAPVFTATAAAWMEGATRAAAYGRGRDA